MNKVLGRLLLTGLLIMMSVTLTGAQQAEVIVFIGHPKVKVAVDGVLEEGAVDIAAENVPKFVCVIVRKGDIYYWKSRNRSKLKVEKQGLFFTFKRPDHPDYVRIVDPRARELYSALSDIPFDYVEHLTAGLKSITYYGKATIDLPTDIQTELNIQ